MVLVPFRNVLWTVFFPLCLLRWWVYGRFQLPLVATCAVIGVGLIAVLSRPDLYGRTDVGFYVYQGAAALVFALALLNRDPVPRAASSERVQRDERASGEREPG
jgi:hypothetical protein